MASAKFDPHSENGWYLIPADRRHAWWLHLAIVGSCKLRGEPPPAPPDFAAPLLFADVSESDPLAPQRDDSGYLVVPGSFDAKIIP
ncbi:MAG: hypothetical protein U1E25_13900 [Methylocystis sp.]